MYENGFSMSDFDLEHFIVEPEHQEEDFDSMHLFSWQYSPMLFFIVLT